MEKILNEKGIVVAGSSFLLAGFIILIAIALVWLFWKPFILFAFGAILVWAAFALVPVIVQGKEALKWMFGVAAVGGIIIFIAISPLAPALGFSILPSGTTGSFVTAPINYEIGNNIVDVAHPAILYTALMGEYSNINTPKDGKVRAIVDGEQIIVGQAGTCQHITGTSQPSWDNCKNRKEIPVEAFQAIGKTGKVTVRWEYCGTNFGPNFCTGPSNSGEDIWGYGIEIETWIDDEACKLEPGTVIVSESFAAGSTLTTADLRFHATAFCSQLPILVTEAGQVVEQKLEEYQIMQDSFVTIPEGQTWTLFYVTDVSPDMIVVCDEGSYNPQDGTCEVLSGIVHVCSEGIFDPSEGLCTVLPETRFVCELGVYEAVQGKCIYWIPEDQTIAICPEGSELVIEGTGLQKCLYEPEIEILCPKGSYDATLDKCTYLPDTYWEQLITSTLIIVTVVLLVGGIIAWQVIKK